MNIDQALDKELKRICKDKTILDLGGYDGGVCHSAMLSGAFFSTSIDDESWKTYDNWRSFTPYKDVHYIKGNFMDHSGTADIVILKNVIYHTRNPWSVLERARTLTKGVLLLATSYVEGEEAMWKVYKGYEGHPVSWTVAWRPTKNGLIKLLEATGFTDIEILVEGDQGSLALRAVPGELPIGFGERI